MAACVCLCVCVCVCARARGGGRVSGPALLLRAGLCVAGGPWPRARAAWLTLARRGRAPVRRRRHGHERRGRAGAHARAAPGRRHGRRRPRLVQRAPALRQPRVLLATPRRSAAAGQSSPPPRRGTAGAGVAGAGGAWWSLGADSKSTNMDSSADPDSAGLRSGGWPVAVAAHYRLLDADMHSYLKKFGVLKNTCVGRPASPRSVDQSCFAVLHLNRTQLDDHCTGGMRAWDHTQRAGGRRAEF